jgi:hypothetical protein
MKRDSLAGDDRQVLNSESRAGLTLYAYTFYFFNGGSIDVEEMGVSL